MLDLPGEILDAAPRSPVARDVARRAGVSTATVSRVLNGSAGVRADKREAVMRAGHAAGEVFDAHARVADEHGMKRHRLNACGYSLGTTFAPNWMDWPMAYAGQAYVVRPGNVFFLHMILFDEAHGNAMTLARTSLVTEAGAEPLSQASLDPIRC